MSHSSGKVRFKDGGIMHYEYNGTSDVCISSLYPTFDEMWVNWRNHEWKICTCDKEEEVEIYSGYGGGFYFIGNACKQCLSLRATSLPDFFWGEEEYKNYDVEDREDVDDDWANGEEVCLKK